MAREEVLGALESAARRGPALSQALEQRPAAAPSRPVAEIVAEDRADGGEQDEQKSALSPGTGRPAFSRSGPTRTIT